MGGVSGNDDAGQMSAWLVWACLGLYPMMPGRPDGYYVLSSPLARRAELRLDARTQQGGSAGNGNDKGNGNGNGNGNGGDNGGGPLLHTFAINAASSTGLDEAMYIQGAFLDGARLERAWLFHRELFAHTNLTLVMGESPNMTWGSDRLPPMTMAGD